MTDEERRLAVIELAQAKVRADGNVDSVEIDNDAKVSEGGDNGAFVQAWVWVDFAGTRLDRR